MKESLTNLINASIKNESYFTDEQMNIICK
mgnify:FL=1